MANGNDLVGKRLTTARRKSGLSQLQFADMIGRSESWVSKVECGQIPLDSLALASRIGELLRVNVAYLLGLNDATPPATSLHSDDGTLRLVHLMVNPLEWEMWDETKRRRFFVQAAGAVMGVLGMLKDPPPPDFAARVDATRSGRVRLDTETVEGLEQTTLGLRRAYRSASAHSLLGPAHGTLNLLMEMAPQAGEHQDRVVTAIGQMSALVGVMLTLDLGDFEAAKHYLAISVRAAQQANNTELLAFTLGGRAFHSTYNGDPTNGREFADTALDVARRGISPRTHGWVSAVASEMHATDQDELVCQRLLEDAAAHLERVDQTEPWTGIGVFNAEKLTAYQGGDYVRLGRYDQAQATLHQALDQLDPSLTKHRCTAYVDLADAYALDAKIDEGAEQAINALRIVQDTRHAASLHRLTALHRWLRPQRAASVRRFGDMLTEVKAAL